MPISVDELYGAPKTGGSVSVDDLYGPGDGSLGPVAPLGSDLDLLPLRGQQLPVNPEQMPGQDTWSYAGQAYAGSAIEPADLYRAPGWGPQATKPSQPAPLPVPAPPPPVDPAIAQQAEAERQAREKAAWLANRDNWKAPDWEKYFSELPIPMNPGQFVDWGKQTDGSRIFRHANELITGQPLLNDKDPQLTQRIINEEYNRMREAGVKNPVDWLIQQEAKKGKRGDLLYRTVLSAFKGAASLPESTAEGIEALFGGGPSQDFVKTRNADQAVQEMIDLEKDKAYDHIGIPGVDTGLNYATTARHGAQAAGYMAPLLAATAMTGGGLTAAATTAEEAAAAATTASNVSYGLFGGQAALAEFARLRQAGEGYADSALQAMGTGLIEAGTEMLGGHLGSLGGASTLQEQMAKLLTKREAKIFNSTVAGISKKVGQWALGAGMEGGEEVLAGLLSQAKDEMFGKLSEGENLTESFIIGALLGLGGQVPEMAEFIRNPTPRTARAAGIPPEAAKSQPELDALAQKVRKELDRMRNQGTVDEGVLDEIDQLPPEEQVDIYRGAESLSEPENEGPLQVIDDYKNLTESRNLSAIARLAEIRGGDPAQIPGFDQLAEGLRSGQYPSLLAAAESRGNGNIEDGLFQIAQLGVAGLRRELATPDSWISEVFQKTKASKFEDQNGYPADWEDVPAEGPDEPQGAIQPESAPSTPPTIRTQPEATQEPTEDEGDIIDEQGRLNVPVSKYLKSQQYDPSKPSEKPPLAGFRKKQPAPAEPGRAPDVSPPTTASAPGPAVGDEPPPLHINTQERERIKGLVDEALPKSGGKVSVDDGVFTVEFPGGAKFDFQPVDEISISDKAVSKGLRDYEMEDTPKNRKSLRRRARGVHFPGYRVVSANGTVLDIPALIQLRKDIGEDEPGVFRHEALHFARGMGLITDEEWNALLEKHAPGYKVMPEGAQQEVLNRIFQQEPGLWQKIKHFIDMLLEIMGAPGGVTRTERGLYTGSVLKRTPREMDDSDIKFSLEPEKEPPRWHSTARNLIEQKMGPKGSPSQIYQMLIKNGAKEEELEWSGLKDLLGKPGGPQVTKEQVLAALDGVKVQEVIRGVPPKSGPFWRRLVPFGETATVRDDEGRELARNLTRDEAEKAVAQQPKFSKWQLPGGKNYRELLITLPSVSKSKGEVRNDPDGNKEFPWAVVVNGREINRARTEEVARNELKDELDKADKRGSGPMDYRSGHWDEPNILAHTRFNERTDSDGKKVLFIEEIQSDWHQAGRKKGYNNQAAPFVYRDPGPNDLDALRPEPQSNPRFDPGWMVVDGRGDEFTGEIYATRQEAIRVIEDVENRERESGSGAIPDAPFKKSWPMLAMKRMIQWAAEHGFDKIAWTTGRQQAERYDLSKQVAAIQYDDEGSVYIKRKGSGRWDPEPLAENVPEDKLADYIGKEAAAKLLASNPVEIEQGEDSYTSRLLEGEDLRIGGEGMKGFYDQMLPAETNKLIKKFGAKVSPVKIGSPGEASWDKVGGDDTPPMTVQGFEITDAMRKSAMDRGQALFEIKPEELKLKNPVANREFHNSEYRVTIKTHWNKFLDYLRGIKDSALRAHRSMDPKKWGAVLEVARQIEEIPSISRAQAVDTINSLTKGLNPTEFQLYRKLVILRDLQSDVDKGKYDGGHNEFGDPLTPLPFSGPNDEGEWTEYTKEDLKGDLERFEGMLKDSKPVQEALDRRREFFRDLAQSLVLADLLPEEVLDNEDYFHHQVLDFLALDGKQPIEGGILSQRLAPSKKGFQKARTGSARNYNTDYLDAEYAIISQALGQLMFHAQFQRVKRMVDQFKSIVPGLKKKWGREWRRHLPDGYKLWQPTKGHVAYKANSVSERALQQFIEDMGLDPGTRLKDMTDEEAEEFAQTLQKKDFKDVMAIGARRSEWLVPTEVYEFLEHFREKRDDHVLENAAAAGINTWKQWRLMSALFAIKYNVKNFVGDFTAIAGYFGRKALSWEKFSKSSQDLWNLHYGDGTLDPEMARAIELRAIGAGRSSEISRDNPHLADQDFFAALAGKRGFDPKKLPGNVIMGYTKRLTKFREDILRLMAWRQFKEDLEGPNARKIYGASDPDVINQLWKAGMPKDEIAARLAADLMLDYGNRSQTSEWISRHAVPFWSWMGKNTVRYLRLIDNARKEGDGKAAAGYAAMYASGKTAQVALTMAMFSVGVQIWNTMMLAALGGEDNDDSEELTVIVGVGSDGTIYRLPVEDSFSDFLSWLDLQDAGRDVRKLVKGEKTWSEQGWEAAQAPWNRVFNGLSPFYKTAAEAMSGQSYFPDAFNPRPVRDWKEHLAKLFIPRAIYRELTRLPADMGLSDEPGKPDAVGTTGELIAGLLLNTEDPGEAAYYIVRNMASEFSGQGGYRQSSGPEKDKADALYYHKQAIKFKQPELAEAWKQKYFAYGGTPEGVFQSIEAQQPLEALNDRQRADFLEGLSKEKRDLVERAQKWFDKTYETKLNSNTRTNEPPYRYPNDVKKLSMERAAYARVRRGVLSQGWPEKAGEVTPLEDLFKKFETDRKADLDWLVAHKDDKIVRESLDAWFASEKFSDAVGLIRAPRRRRGQSLQEWEAAKADNAQRKAKRAWAEKAKALLQGGAGP